jgi:predicted DNA-binding protein with PD1-like motif
MIKKLLIIAVLLLSAQITFAQQEEYVKPGQVIEKNKAPAMKVKLLSTTGKVKTYIVVLNRGDDILSGLTEFAEKYQIKFAHFTGLGAISSGRFGSYDRARQMYHIIPIKGQAETTSFTGNIATFNGKPTVHVHMSVSQTDGTMRGGHLFQATVWPTLEIIVTVEPTPLYKKKETDTGFALADPDLTE